MPEGITGFEFRPLRCFYLDLPVFVSYPPTSLFNLSMPEGITGFESRPLRCFYLDLLVLQSTHFSVQFEYAQGHYGFHIPPSPL